MSMDDAELPGWARTFVGRFGCPFGFDADGWEEIIGQIAGYWTQREATEAMAWMQETAQRATWGDCATADQLARGILACRRQQSIGRPAMLDARCAICRGTGWLSHYAGCDPAAATLADYEDAYVCAVPCICAVGDGITRTCRPYRDQDEGQRAALREMSHAAARQAQARDRLFATAAALGSRRRGDCVA